MLKDELQALQLTYCKLEERYKELQMHHDDIVSRWMTQKSELADRLNDENDKMFQMQRAKRKVELEDAAKEMQPDIRLSSGSDTMCPRLDGALFGGLATIPSRVLAKQEIHEGEVNALAFSGSGKMFATGGADRKVRLWTESGGVIESKGMLTGSNAPVMSVQFNIEEDMVLAASCDYASRIWTVNDQRPRFTLTRPHFKIKNFLFIKLLSCSRDDTLKIIDLRQEKVLRTLCADGFHVAADWARSAFSPDGQYAVAGSTDSAIYIWSTTTGKVETVLKDKDQSGSVMCCSWHPNGNSLFTCDRNRKLLVWF
ncbi:PREDICTED: autophagy-related protein 16-like [Priapulus caudatus]|uniref:Autophagy-related protein 16-like n=1 Tax=Priapulus caudatus TaxID=37621 RepID=A0ABM1EU62_PRICU|nr:PREDICTED: autophagy-related protein 16-like [Priapulus caudatus]